MALEEETAAAVADLARTIAREEIASMAGLVLRRLQEATFPGDGHVVKHELLAIFGEALRDFGGTEAEPGKDQL